MNLVKIADLLKNASDQNLMQEMQNPSGSAPSYMVMSELQRRKKLRGSLMNNEAQTSVAEDMEAESSRANQMGLGSMGVNPMERAGVAPESQGYAGGGEIRLFGGGSNWWEDPKQYSNYDPTNPKMQQNRINEMRAAIRDKYQVDPENMGMMTSLGQGIGNFFGSGSQQNQALNDYESAKKGLSLINATSPSAAPAPTPNPNATRNQGGPNSAAPIPIQRNAEPQATSFVDSLLKNADADRTQMREAHQGFKDMLAAQTEEVKKSKNTDIALTLMQAGLGIAGGRSQYALENVGQGGQAALQQYAGMERDRQKQLSQLAMAQGQAGIAGLKDVQGINKDLATLEYQKQHGKYFEQAGQAAMMNARTSAANTGQYKAAASEARMIALREKALEALGKDQNFQFMSPQQQEAAIQRRMQLIGIPGSGSAASAGPAIAGTYNPKTGKIE